MTDIGGILVAIFFFGLAGAFTMMMMVATWFMFEETEIGQMLLKRMRDKETDEAD